ncbi:hypothetical protein [Mycobacterium sp. 1423905.2]|uniref:hypothetical protein n=1 Tax=Mycobacterium sp. 1423905.2 TaxID=1856859 RepID=UPI0007FF60C2|nr:hypothetical protein [Mycobacterium sp. 1423905.2]OBJ52949.1 hypothetical protein A9W95_19425 [Mycobacterium sp. 1423905.2]
MTFEMQPEFMQGLTAAQEAASTAITSAFSMVTPAQLSSFSMALGPIAVANMIPAMYESTANNVASGMLTAANHALLGGATHISQAAYIAADSATDV